MMLLLQHIHIHVHHITHNNTVNLLMWRDKKTKLASIRQNASYNVNTRYLHLYPVCGRSMCISKLKQRCISKHFSMNSVSFVVGVFSIVFFPKTFFYCVSFHFEHFLFRLFYPSNVVLFPSSSFFIFLCLSKIGSFFHFSKAFQFKQLKLNIVWS